jgi:hypothetical protein
MEGLKRIAAAINLLRDENLRGFRVDIEVDSTVYGDAAQEKQDRVEFVESVTKFIQVSAQVGAQIPQAAPLFGKMLQFAVRGFRVGRDLESTIDDFVDEMDKLAQQHAAAPPPPNPEQVKAQAALATAQSDLQQAKIKSQSDLQQTQLKGQADTQQAAAEVQRQQVEAQAEQANSQAEMQRSMMDMRMRAMEMEIEKYKMQVQIQQMHIDKHKATLEALRPPEPPQQASLGKPL